MLKLTLKRKLPTKKHRFIPHALLALVALALVGCGKQYADMYSFQALLDSCAGLPADQKGSFMAPLPAVPVKIIVDSRFDDSSSSSPYILNSIQTAVQEWNTYGQGVTKSDFFSYSVQTVPDFLSAPNSIDCGADLGSTAQFYIVRVDDQTQWTNLGFNSHTPGATVRCYTDGALTKQIILVNPALVNQAQLPLVFTHELGHSTGLEHSCLNGAATADYASCIGLPVDHPYRVAIMYPTIPSVVTTPSPTPSPSGNVIIQANDKTRANCFYQAGQ